MLEAPQGSWSPKCVPYVQRPESPPTPPQRDVTLTWHNPFCCFAPLKSGTCVNQAGGTDAGHLRGCPVLVLRPAAAAQGPTPVSAGQGQGVN